MASSAADQYKYKPLNLARPEIRLLHLPPGRWRGPILCSLSTVSLDDKPHYEALSYCWGNQAIVKPICLDSHLRHVTTNLEAALRRLRHRDRPRCLWVDALCINQADDIEKSHQVNLMKEIYSNAAEVLLWLGDYSERTIPARILEALGGSASTSPTHNTAATRADIEKAFSFTHRLSIDQHFTSTPKDIRQLMMLVDQPWWDRIWTVQEAILPRKATIMYGEMQMPWSTISSAAGNWFKHRAQKCCRLNSPETEQMMIKFYYKVNAIEYQRGERYGLLKLLHRFRDRVASDPRDMVFGLLGLVPSGIDSPAIIADYSMSTVGVYIGLTLNSIKRSGDLFSLLRMREQLQTRMPNLPSWVPDWAAQICPDAKSSADEFMRLSLYPFYQASSTATAVLRASENPSALALAGVVVDEVATLGQVCNPATLAEWKMVHQSWSALLPHNGTDFAAYPGGGTYGDAFWRLLTRDVIGDIVPSGDSVAGTLRRATAYDLPLVLSDYDHDTRVHCQFHFQDQRLLITKKGLIGLGSQDMLVGDTVHVLLGGRVPFILRPVNEPHNAGQVPSPRCFRYVCDAYVHGIMDGEGLNMGRWETVVLI
jgi:hypothetical protein